jgi:hypothetical protein
MTRFALLAVVAWAGAAHAYSWMIRHDYTGCAQCHVDPSGGSQLTAYGRAQSEVLLRTPWAKRADDWEPGKTGDVLFGALELPEELLLGADLRGAVNAWLSSKAPAKVFPMQVDLTAAVASGRLRVSGSLGAARGSAALPATVVGEDWRLVSRHHWVGAVLGAEDEVMVRAGRMNLPFGIRTTDHVTFVRSATATDLNEAQQHGVAVSYSGTLVRGEVMGIAGNLQLSPPELRERGYSGFIEWTPTGHLAVGLSSLITHAERDAVLGTPRFRHAHGLMGRVALGPAVVLGAEADLLLHSAKGDAQRAGAAALANLDVEPLQGLHFGATGELLCTEFGKASCQLGAWGSVWWFFAPHADVRLDVITRSTSGVLSSSLLMQLHVFL